MVFDLMEQGPVSSAVLSADCMLESPGKLRRNRGAEAQPQRF